MTYEEVWKEHKEWLEKSIAYLKERMDKSSGKEKERIKNKLEGLTVSLQNVQQAERIYVLK